MYDTAKKEFLFTFEDDEKDSTEIDQNDSNEDEEDEIEDSFDPFKYNQIYASPSDWTISTLIDQIEKGIIKLDPSYQRKDAWSKKEKSKFIESLILNIPVPNMLFAEEIGKRGYFNVLDGKQRLQAILGFYGTSLGKVKKPKMNLSKLTILSYLNGKNIDEVRKLDPSLITALDNYSIRTTTLRNIPGVEYLYEIFERINMGSKKLSPQELRQSRYPGPFLSYLHSEADKENPFRELLKSKESDGRMRDIELMLRGHAFKFYIKKYPNSISQFLDDATDYLNTQWKTSSSIYISHQNELKESIIFTKSIFRSTAFTLVGLERKNYPFNRALFDLFTYFFSDQNVRVSILLKPEKKFIDLYLANLMTNQEFIDVLTTNTHQGTITKRRFYLFYSFLRKEYDISEDETIDSFKNIL